MGNYLTVKYVKTILKTPWGYWMIPRNWLPAIHTGSAEKLNKKGSETAASPNLFQKQHYEITMAHITYYNKFNLLSWKHYFILIVKLHQSTLLVNLGLQFSSACLWRHQTCFTESAGITLLGLNCMLAHTSVRVTKLAFSELQQFLLLPWYNVWLWFRIRSQWAKLTHNSPQPEVFA